MSWSFHKRAAARHTSRLIGVFLAAGAALAVGGISSAAETYIQPSASLTAEHNSNLDLDPTGGQELQGYTAKLAALFDIATPTWESTIRPRLEYRNYPGDSSDNRLEGYLDMNSIYRGQRSSASILGVFEHRDDINAEFSSALYDSINPVPPTTPQTGQAVHGDTRDSLLLMPKYAYDITPIVNTGVSGIYQGVRYHPSDDNFHVNFNYYYGEAFVGWDYSARSTLTFGGYGSHYEATQYDSTATGAGPTVEWNTKWSQLLSTDATAVYQRTKVDQTAPVLVHETNSTWGATFGVVYKAQASEYRMNVGRIITPSGAGSVYVNDQLQFQYNRDLTERFAFTGALIALHNHPVTSEILNAYDREYGQAVVELKWMWTRTLYLLGGYQYQYQKYKADPNGAGNNRVYITFGYLGLPRQR